MTNQYPDISTKSVFRISNPDDQMLHVPRTASRFAKHLLSGGILSIRQKDGTYKEMTMIEASAILEVYDGRRHKIVAVNIELVAGAIYQYRGQNYLAGDVTPDGARLTNLKTGSSLVLAQQSIVGKKIADSFLEVASIIS